MLYEQDNPTKKVAFQFNPKTIKVGHGANLSELGAKTTPKNDSQTGTGSSDNNLGTLQMLDKLGKTSLKLADVLFDGAYVLQNCGTLLSWSYAYPTPITIGARGTLPKRQLMPLTFTWGQFMLGAETTTAIPVILTRVDVTYERFTPTGRPIRATVSLDLQPTAQNPLAQNPTSGGLAGRGGHMMISGETLPGIAVAQYGHPSAWRTLAEANDLDDPLRARPGSVLYLPSGAELTALEPA
jgi:hypothetical protein